MDKLLLFVYVILLSSSVIAQNNGSFPPDFLFGVGTSAYQTEGAWNVDGKGENIWDRWIHDDVTHIADNETADIACNSYEYYERDIRYAKEINMSHYQFSISWSRILPNGNDVNVKGILYYKAFIDLIRKLDMIPVATLYHQDLPQPLQDIGGWMNPEIVNYFVKYARIAFENFENVGYWLTFNDPQSTCRLGYGEGTYAPGIALDGVGEYLCAYVLVKSHAEVYHLYKNEFPSQTAKMSIAINLEWSEPATDDPENVEAAERRILFEFGLYANPIYKGNWPQIVIDRVGDRSKNENLPKSRLPELTQGEIDYINGTFDFMGINMFYTNLVADTEEAEYGDPSYVKDMKVEVSVDPEWEISSDGKPITPWGAWKALRWLRWEYMYPINPEIFITGNGVSDFESDSSNPLDDYGRFYFYIKYLDAILDAMYDGDVNVIGYTAWSLLDSFEWTRGYSKPYGLYQVHLNSTLKRQDKFFASQYRVIATTHVIHDPPLTTEPPRPTTTTTPATTTPDSASQIEIYSVSIIIITYFYYLLLIL